MMRLPYISDPPSLANNDDQAIVERIRQRRGEKGLIALDRTLLHSPPIADGWNSFLGSIRTGSSLSASIRESAICRIAVLNKAWYEWESHVPILRSSKSMSPLPVVASSLPSYVDTEKSQDVTEAHINALLKSPPHEILEGVLDESHRAVVSYTDAMTLYVQVSQDIFARLTDCFSEKEIVEITATVAAYNCVSRFLVALDIGERNAQIGPNEGNRE